ncbi:MAG: UvrD-helicase domain-containing protein, partial [Woeseiaceae bacterium]|nr:UvrD-helicase domain-containing protein [Woeseiaceae bacterium]
MSDDARLLAADRQARSDALDIGRSFIVQAPAGSGKTELLIQRYLCLLGRVEHPEEILAITFTRKAAAEMRLRILSALQRARQGVAPEQEHLKITHHAALEVLARDDSSGWQLIENPRRMRIQTLDSLNASITRMQPLTSAGATSGQAIVDEVLMKNLSRQAAAATFDYLGAGGVVGEATRDVLRHVDNNTGVYISYLARMLRTRDQWLPFVGHGQLTAADAAFLRRRFEENLARIVDAHIAALRSAAPAGLETDMLGLAAYAADNLGLDVVTDPASAACWLQVAGTLLKDDGAFRQRVDKRHGFLPDNKQRKQALADLIAALDGCDDFVQLLHGVRELPPPSYNDEQWSVLVSLFRLLPVAAAELRRICIANGVTDHIDVAISAEKALGSPEEPGDVALLLDYQVRHILVDEMQDTSKAQYRMLEALTAGWEPGDGRTLFCVGDPMQSIYRFRNAEVAQFLLARDQGIGAIRLEPLLLRRNFRSGAGLVRWFNAVFPQVMAPHDDPASGAVAYSEATPAEALHGFGECRVYPLFGGSRDVEASRGCEIIRDTLAANPGDSMAVLVRSRTQLPELLSQLRQQGIGYQAVEIDRLTDLPEVIELLALTRALVHGGDRIAWLALLR